MCTYVHAINHSPLFSSVLFFPPQLPLDRRYSAWKRSLATPILRREHAYLAIARLPAVMVTNSAMLFVCACACSRWMALIYDSLHPFANSPVCDGSAHSSGCVVYGYGFLLYCILLSSDTQFSSIRRVHLSIQLACKYSCVC